jgi:hypothetical protein
MLDRFRVANLLDSASRAGDDETRLDARGGRFAAKWGEWFGSNECQCRQAHLLEANDGER